METSKRHPEIRVYAHTRHQLKVLAAQRGVTLPELVEQLVQQELAREQKGESHEGVQVQAVPNESTDPTT
jgi:hypothetical protein